MEAKNIKTLIRRRRREELRAQRLFNVPFNGSNNRKKTKARRETDRIVQSIPIFNDEDIRIGYRYIVHRWENISQ